MLTARLRAMLAALSAFALAAAAIAGPSFNSNREKFEEASRRAGAKLHEAVELTHAMYRLLELRKNDDAEASRQKAIKTFEEARSLYAALAKDTPNQPLKISPTSSESAQAAKDLVQYCNVLKIKPPDTERQLAEVAAAVVEKHRTVLSETKMSGTPADYQPMRVLMKSEAFVMDVGIVTSIVWTISPAQ